MVRRQRRKRSYSKLDAKRLLITQLKRFDYGREQMGRIIAPVSFVIAIFTLLKVYNISFEFQVIGSLITVSVVLLFFVGYVWDRSGLVEEEIEYGNERNRFVRAVLESRYHRAWLKYLQQSKISRR